MVTHQPSPLPILCWFRFNKKQKRTQNKPYPIPGPKPTRPEWGGELWGSAFYLGLESQRSPEERPPGAAAGALPVPEWPESDTAGRAERSRLGMLSGGQAPRWAPVSHRVVLTHQADTSLAGTGPFSSI